MERPAYHPYDRNDTTHGGAREVVDEEVEHLRKWRGRAPRNGIALSGGGIRAASFGLGMLQALAHQGLLHEFDYLSSVSGGGYTNASLAYLLHESQRHRRPGDGTTRPQFGVTKKSFPLLSYPMVDTPTPTDDPWVLNRGRLLRRLRQNANYLAPGRGITIVSLIAVILRNSLAAVLVHGAVIVILLELLVGLNVIGKPGPLPTPAFSWPSLQFNALWLSLYAFSFFVLISLLYLPSTRLLARISDFAPAGAYRVRRWYERWAAYALVCSLSFLAIGVVPLVGALKFRGLVDSVWSKVSSADGLGVIVAALGVLGNIWAGFRARRESGRKGLTTALAIFGSAALLFGVVLFLFHWTLRLEALAPSLPGISQSAMVCVAALVVLFVFGWLPDSSYVSLHRYYRDRLMETFMPELRDVERDPAERTAASISGETTMLGSLCGADDPDASPDATPAEKLARGPYPILNANIVLVASKVSGYRGRGGDNFVFTPLVIGSRATGWKRTGLSRDVGPTLATAMAISGAAINPNSAPLGEGLMRRPVLSVLMSLFNIRLGVWHRNPATAQDAPENPSFASILLRLVQPTKRPNLISPGLIESFGRKNLTEESPWVLLTDGGHFENLGLYELIRRRLSVIVVCDGSNDPGCGFADLANAVEKVRADFGAIVDIKSEDLDALIPRPDSDDPQSRQRPAIAKRGYLKARIQYARRSGESEMSEPEVGTLFYFTTTFCANLKADLYGYRCAHKEFPDQSTGDQFFDERQFEAYRELGFETAYEATGELEDELTTPSPEGVRVVAVILESRTGADGFPASETVRSLVS